MRKIAVLLIMSAVLSVSQDQQPKPRLSKDPLSDEQVEVYRTFLRSYLNGDDAQSLNIANVTVPLNEEPGELREGKGCLRGIALENFKGANSTVHLLPQAVAINSGIHLVDPDKQNEQVKANRSSSLSGRETA